MSYNVRLHPVQTLSTVGAAAAAIDFTATFLPDRTAPFFISIFNSGTSGVYVVRIGETSSGVFAASGESVTAGPFDLDNANGVLELFFDGAGKAEVSFITVISEGV